MSSSGYGYTAAPRTVDVLPARVSRRVTRRDGLLPLLLALELAVGVAFGIAGTSGSSAAPATSATAKVELGEGPLVTVLPSTRPVAMVRQVVVAAGFVGPVAPGTVRAAPVAEPVVTVAAPVALPTPYAKHAPRNPFLTLVRS